MSHSFHKTKFAIRISKLWAMPCKSAAVLAAFLLSSASVHAQAPLPSSPWTASSQTASGEDGAATLPASNGVAATAAGSGYGATSQPSLEAADATGGTVLPAEEIVRSLEENPDVAVELKSLAAERMQSQGSQLDANEITDEAFYQQIESNASLRAGITMFLRARGYTVAQGQESYSASGLTGARASDPTNDWVGDSATAQRFSSLDSSAAMRGRSLEGSMPIGLANSAGNLETPAAVGADLQARRGAGSNSPGAPPANASTDMPHLLRKAAPYNLRSMRDLYTQVSDQQAELKRFGSNVFLDRKLLSDERSGKQVNAPLDIPIGPDYVLGAGDALDIHLWGGVTQHVTPIVGPDGSVALPEAGSVQVAGLTLERARSLIEASLKPQFRNLQLSVTVGRLRSVRVYVVGDVQRPGGYDISALATPITGLQAAGGPTAAGSLRLARHMRGEALVEETDLYDFLLHGMRKGSARFQSGDTLLVPPAGPQAAVSGAVRRPAIYELKPGESSLSQLIEDAGGMLPAASPTHIVVERIEANRGRTTLALPGLGAGNAKNGEDSAQALREFKIEDGDRVRIESILPYSERAIYVEGHVARPGRMAYRDGMRLSDVLQSYRDLLPEPADRGEIVRLAAPDLHAETIAFQLPDVLIGNANADLQPFDTVRIFSRYEADAPRVTVSGEVLRPGTYPLSRGMTAAQLVRMAGGFKRDALLESADLTSYDVAGGSSVAAHLNTLPIGAAVSGADPQADLPLKPGDVLAVHQIAGWNDIGQSIVIEGQVRYPGAYGFKEGERLSSVLRRAGGFLPTAYPMGAVLARNQVRELELKSRDELIRQIQANSAAARLSPNIGASDEGGTLQLIKAQQDQLLADLRNHPPSGRMVIRVDTDIDSWANTEADIELRRGDKLTIPKRPGFVLVTGQVYNATALTFSPDKTAGWYLSHAGGANTTADRKEIFIIRANGSVIGRHSGSFTSSVLSTRLNPGDVVVVPQKIIGRSLFWRNLLATAQVASSIAITASVASL